MAQSLLGVLSVEADGGVMSAVWIVAYPSQQERITKQSGKRLRRQLPTHHLWLEGRLRTAGLLIVSDKVPRDHESGLRQNHRIVSIALLARGHLLPNTMVEDVEILGVKLPFGGRKPPLGGRRPPNRAEYATQQKGKTIPP